jgi:hypothetical protein
MMFTFVDLELELVCNQYATTAKCWPQHYHRRDDQCSASPHADHTAFTTTSFSLAGAAAKVSTSHSLRSSQVK